MTQCKLRVTPWLSENNFFVSVFVILLLIDLPAFSQVRIRIYANSKPGSSVISITKGLYRLIAYPGKPSDLSAGRLIYIAKAGGKLVVKTQEDQGFICDSVTIKATAGDGGFSVRPVGTGAARQYYSGDFFCKSDLGTLFMINSCDPEAYIAGVVRAEGGYNKSEEYFKTQAVIARTYMYRHLDKHLNDGYNLCDNTHCQAFNGITDDSVIAGAVKATRNEVILGPDSTLIISAFHSNCGGETANAGDVWLSGLSYLEKVTDPWCRNSRNAVWQKSYSKKEWTDYLVKNGFRGNRADTSLLNFSQKERKPDFRAGNFTMPVRQIRDDLGLRSSFFSVMQKGDSVILNGRGYGHGVGLCQEGAMVMAGKGFDYRKIISFYYTGVVISDIKNAKPILK